jgi:hypothetical protein
MVGNSGGFINYGYQDIIILSISYHKFYVEFDTPVTQIPPKTQILTHFTVLIAMTSMVSATIPEATFHVPTLMGVCCITILRFGCSFRV